MKRTTIFIDEPLERDLQALAERQGRSKAAVVRTALERYVRREKRRADLELGFVAVGRSGRSDIAERHEECLWQEVGEEEARQPKGRARPGARRTKKAGAHKKPD